MKRRVERRVDEAMKLSKCRTFLKKHLLLSCLIGFAAVFIMAFNLLFYNGSHELLSITETGIKENHCNIVGSYVAVPRKVFTLHILDRPGHNPEFYAKYKGMYDKKRLFYILSPQEVMETVLSGGSVEEAQEAWATHRYVNIRVSADGTMTSFNYT